MDIIIYLLSFIYTTLIHFLIKVFFKLRQNILNFGEKIRGGEQKYSKFWGENKGRKTKIFLIFLKKFGIFYKEILLNSMKGQFSITFLFFLDKTCKFLNPNC